MAAQPPQEITHDDMLSMILKCCDVPELLAMRSVSKAFKRLISEDKAFIQSYNLPERTDPWVFSYSVVTQEEEQVGFIYGTRLFDEKRVIFGPFEGGKKWSLVDMSDSLLLFLDNEDNVDYFVVVNPITKTVDRVAVPDDFPEDAFEYYRDYNWKITTDAAGYNIVYHHIVDDELCCFQYDSSDGGRWAKSKFVCEDRMTPEDEKRRRIVLNIFDEGLGEVLYTLFYRAGNDVPVYKVTSPIAESFDLDDDEEEFPEVKTWHYCGGSALFMEYKEKKMENDDSKRTMNAIGMSLYSRKKDGTEYEFRVRVQDLLPDDILLASLSMKELDGVLYFAFQTDSVGDNVAATTYVYRYLIEEGLMLERLEFPPLDNGNRHSQAVFTRRLTLPEP